MKKLAVIVLIVAAGAVLLIRHTFTAERRSCARIVELCGGKAEDLDRCVGNLSDLRQRSGNDVADRFHACVRDAQSCAQGSGCAIGAGLGAAGAAVGNFFKGIGEALKK